MKENDFLPGYITWRLQKKSKEQILNDSIDLSVWDDGYIAFSNQELRLNQVQMDFKTLLASEPVNKNGYLMEIDLWRHENEMYEELSIERDDDGFLCQTWTLNVKLCQEITPNCFYRKVNTLTRHNVQGGNAVFDREQLKSIEVVMFEKRITLFLTYKD
jgi:hypothetical protein